MENISFISRVKFRKVRWLTAYIVAVAFLLMHSNAYAGQNNQSEYEKLLRQMSQSKKQISDEITQYKNELDRQFAQFLAENWQSFKLDRPKKMLNRPKPVAPPVAKPEPPPVAKPEPPPVAKPEPPP
ncbi:MAG: hypothetical protein C0615_01285, partial [Desulfuromonas sp.]